MASNNSTESQEIDLTYLSKSVSSFFDWIGYSLFRFFKFLLKNSIIILILLVLGAVAGYFIDQSTPQKYKHQVIVVPNFNSTTYLYNKVENIKLQDTPITSVEVEPIIDMYEFISDEWVNLEVAKYLSQNNIQINKYSPKSDVEKLYRYHLLTVFTSGKDENGEAIDRLIRDLNDEPYFLERQKIEVENQNILITSLEKSVESIDLILDKLSSSTAKGDLSIEVYSELNELVTSKEKAVNEMNKHKVYQSEESMVIFPASKVLNIPYYTMPYLFLIPLFLIGLFLLIKGLMILVKKYQKIEDKNR